MKEKKFCVYKHTFPNGKVYIGITSKMPKNRWQNGSGYTKDHQNVMYNAIQKYGWENVKHEILFDNLTLSEAQQKEIELIKEYNSYIHSENSNGYNMTLGGEGTLGHIVSNESKLRMSKSHIGMNPPNSIKVVCDDVEYRSISEFACKNNLNAATVRSWLIGKNNMPKYWYDKGLRYLDEERNKNANITVQNEPSKTKIFYNGKVYESQRQLAEELGVSTATLCCWIKGTNSIPIDIYNKGIYLIDSNDNFAIRKSVRKMVSYDGVVYKTQRELAKYLGIDYRTLNDWLTKKTKIPKEYDKDLKYIQIT